jgi:hypothetical protein
MTAVEVELFVDDPIVVFGCHRCGTTDEYFLSDLPRRIEIDENVSGDGYFPPNASGSIRKRAELMRSVLGLLAKSGIRPEGRTT